MCKDVIIMSLKDGLHLFPDNGRFSLYGFHQNRVTEFGTAIGGEMLVDLLDFDIKKFSYLQNLLKHLALRKR